MSGFGESRRLVTSVEEFPNWNCDGSSTNQAQGLDTEVALKPVSYFNHPFLPDRNYLVLCETFYKGRPCESNTRHAAAQALEKNNDLTPKFAFEQEYSIWHNGVHLGFPKGFPKSGYAEPQGKYYCSVGATNAFGRQVAEAHYYACLNAGLEVSGLNAEVLPGQWEFQIGPVQGVAAADQLWIARFLLHRVAEDFNVVIDFDPKPIPGDWNGAGMHTNFCISAFHESNGIDSINRAIRFLEMTHAQDLPYYGEGNERRLSGAHETSYMKTFSFGVGTRSTSIRIPNQTFHKKRGYIEDRRPAANADPYLVSQRIIESITMKRSQVPGQF